MALVVKDRVKETSTTTGTGTLTLAGAVDGFQSFSAIGNGNTTYYAIVSGNDWEVGVGTYTSSGTTLSRDTILESSNSGSALNLGAGTKDVFVTYPAEKSVYEQAASSTIAVGAITDASGGNTATINSVTPTSDNVLGKNKIINGNFLINQRLVSGTVTLSAGAYGHDRFKAGSSGATYTFATSANVTTLTITAGSLIQVIEGNNLQTDTYVLSWTGTAQGKIGSGSYSSSGVTGSVTGGSNLNVEFNTGTLSKVQLEAGSTATDFEHRMYGTELQLCSRYFWRQYNAGQNLIYDRVYWSGSGQNAFFNFPAPPGMRIVNATVTCSPTTNGTSVSFTHQQYGNIVVYRATAAGDNYLYAGDISISAEL